jgi:hypothetical protein
MNTHQTEKFRRRAAGACLILAPLTLAAAQFIHPGQGEDGMVQSVAENAGRVELASLLTVLSSVIFIPAFVGILRLMRDRGSVLGHLGASLAIAGVIGHAVVAGSELILVWLVRTWTDLDQLAALVNAGPQGAAFSVIMLMFIVGFFVGLLLLAAGLLRARTVPWWVALLIGIGPLFDFLPVDNELVFQTGLIMFVVGLSLTGVVLLRGAPDESATAGMKPNLSVQRG